MTSSKTNISAALASAQVAVARLCEDALGRLDSSSGTHAIATHSEIEHRQLNEKSAAFYRSLVPLRTEMIGLLADTYRRYFKLALAHRNETGNKPELWAWVQLQSAVRAALEWLRDWYILACDGQSRRVRHLASIDFAPGQTVTAPIPMFDSDPPADKAWRAPGWLFGVSLVFFGIGLMKTEHVPDEKSEKLSPGHSRLILLGAKRVFLWQLAELLERVRNEEIAAAGAIRAESPPEQKRQPNKRKGWEQREKLYSVIRKILRANSNLQGIAFCAELDRRHALPLWDWVKSSEWREGLTWKEAWRIPKLQRKIRRVRQEAQRKS